MSRFLVISTADKHGGAGRAAYRLFRGLKEIENNSLMIVKDKYTNDEKVIKTELNDELQKAELFLYNYIEKTLIHDRRTSLSNTLFSLPHPGYSVTESEIFRAADIINLHWVTKFQSTDTIADILSTDKPIIWTLHDQNAFTGGCHYSAGCQNYFFDCNNCPQLIQNEINLPMLNLADKIAKWDLSSLTIVTPSRWLSHCVEKSRLFKGVDTIVIPNGIEIDKYAPSSKSMAKVKLGLPEDQFILLFGAFSTDEKRKGFFELVEALEHSMYNRMFSDNLFKNKIGIATFGIPPELLSKLSFPIINFGFKENDSEICDIYNAADIFILPSIEDNLPNTILESMACGTPVIGFNVGGIPDLIEDGVTGFLVDRGDIVKLSEVIIKVIREQKILKLIGKKCRGLVINKFSKELQASQYVNLFQEKLNGRNKKNSVRSENEFINQKNIIYTKLSSSNLAEYIQKLYKKKALEIIDQSIKYKYQIEWYKKEIIKKNLEIRQKNEKISELEKKLLEIPKFD